MKGKNSFTPADKQRIQRAAAKDPGSKTAKSEFDRYVQGKVDSQKASGKPKS